ncbi:50S ribosomal protein L19 [Candidatus Hodgkinia cicadicola]
MNWLGLEEITRGDVSEANFNVGSQLVVVLRGSKSEPVEFEGSCVDVRGKRPCLNYTVRKTYADVWVERRFVFGSNTPHVKFATCAAKKAAFKR